MEYSKVGKGESRRLLKQKGLSKKEMGIERIPESSIQSRIRIRSVNPAALSG
jgi:hypothetical protein